MAAKDPIKMNRGMQAQVGEAMEKYETCPNRDRALPGPRSRVLMTNPLSMKASPI